MLWVDEYRIIESIINFCKHHKVLSIAVGSLTISTSFLGIYADYFRDDPSLKSLMEQNAVLLRKAQASERILASLVAEGYEEALDNVCGGRDLSSYVSGLGLRFHEDDESVLKRFVDPLLRESANLAETGMRLQEELSALQKQIKSLPNEEYQQIKAIAQREIIEIGSDLDKIAHAIRICDITLARQRASQANSENGAFGVVPPSILQQFEEDQK